MKLLTLCAALVGLMFASSSFSATPACSPYSTSAANFEQTTQPSNIAKALTIDGRSASFVVTWYCADAYRWTGWYFYGYRSELSPSWQSILATASKLTLTDINTLWVANVTTPDPTLEALAKRQLEANRPPDIVWRVRANGTQPSRPVFPVRSDGTRNQTAINGERVAVAAQCSCRKLALEEPVTGASAPNVYCTVEGQQNAVKVTARLGTNRLAWCERSP
jgi:hypothetical protein